MITANKMRIIAKARESYSKLEEGWIYSAIISNASAGRLDFTLFGVLSITAVERLRSFGFIVNTPTKLPSNDDCYVGQFTVKW